MLALSIVLERSFCEHNVVRPTKGGNLLWRQGKLQRQWFLITHATLKATRVLSFITIAGAEYEQMSSARREDVRSISSDIEVDNWFIGGASKHGFGSLRVVAGAGSFPATRWSRKKADVS